MDFLDFFVKNFSSCVWLAVIVMALVPTLESKIAIPFAMNVGFWGDKALSAPLAFLLSFIGSILPCLLIVFITRKIKSHTSGFIFENIKLKYKTKTALIEKQDSTLKKFLMLMWFVAIPLPLTGVWTGSLVAGLTNMDIFKSFIAISIGSLISCGIITLLCVFFENSIGYILLASLILIAISIVLNLIISLAKKKAAR